MILDDCWSDGRYENGTLRPDFTKFPNGMKAVADSLHSMGLKFGMYSSAGYLTCARYPGSLGKEDLDRYVAMRRSALRLLYVSVPCVIVFTDTNQSNSQTFASWDVDYLKYDNCFNGGAAGNQWLSSQRYLAMSKALNATNRPIVYGLCNWGEDSPWNWAATQANSWRMSGDIYDSFSRPDSRCPCTGDEGYDCALPGFHCSVLNIMNKLSSTVSKTQPGAQADMDMLEVGNGGMDDNEYMTHMSIWSLNSSPLIMGNDVRKIDASALSILSNPAVIAVNQDPTSTAGQRVWRYYVNDTDEWGQGEIALWARTLNNSDVAMALVNAGNSSRQMNATLAEIFTDSGAANAPQAQMGYDIYDLWGYRMDNATANMVLNGTAPEIQKNSTMRYNATAMSYADGLSANETALIGKKIDSVDPLGTINAMVPRHGVAFYRLRANGKTMMRKRDEL